MTSPALLPPETRSDLQGLIGSGFGHLPEARYLLLHFHSSGEARRWLGDLLPHITTGAPWPEGPDGRRIRPSRARNVAFTADGLRALGLPERVVGTFPPDVQEGAAHPERARAVGDQGINAPEGWEFGGGGTLPVDALVLLHATDPEGARVLVEEERERLAVARGGVEEHPGGLQEGTLPPGHYEPFGFRDGMGQPSVEGLHGDGGGVPTGEFVLGYPNHYGILPPAPVVPSDLDPQGWLPPLENPHHPPGTWRELGRNGSYLVYRKLEQDVAGFWTFMKTEAQRLEIGEDAAAMVWLAARCVGRWPGGAPLILSPDEDDPTLAREDHFGFSEDPVGFRCPVGAHIRRTNPRDFIRPYGKESSLRMSRAHRILRRGRIFGSPLFDPELLQSPGDPKHNRALRELVDDGTSRGIHFLCVNASITSQFEFVQQAWCNSPHFNGLREDPDPITGQGDRPGFMAIPAAGRELRMGPLPSFVRVRGGVYLFLPGMRALGYLAGGRWGQ